MTPDFELRLPTDTGNRTPETGLAVARRLRWFEPMALMIFAMVACLAVGPVTAQTVRPAIADSDLQERVRATLLALRVLSVERDEIRVDVTDGVVSLTGCTATKAEKQEIDLRVKLITGVRSLNNDLAVGCPDDSDGKRES